MAGTSPPPPCPPRRRMAITDGDNMTTKYDVAEGSLPDLIGCVFLIAVDELCGKAYKVHAGGLPLCEEHSATLYWWRQSHANQLVAQVYEEHPDTEHTTGWTYVVRLPNGRVKIGYTGRSVEARFKEIHRRYGARIEVVGVLKGGRSLEATLHHRWDHLRVTNEHGEQYEPDAAMHEWLGTLEIHSSQYPAVRRYNAYEYDPVPKIIAIDVKSRRRAA